MNKKGRKSAINQKGEIKIDQSSGSLQEQGGIKKEEGDERGARCTSRRPPR
jgi:hypothetical protein